MPYAPWFIVENFLFLSHTITFLTSPSKVISAHNDTRSRISGFCLSGRFGVCIKCYYLFNSFTFVIFRKREATYPLFNLLFPILSVLLRLCSLRNPVIDFAHKNRHIGAVGFECLALELDSIEHIS